jgi:SNF2 family DNA or RNA helicase
MAKTLAVWQDEKTNEYYYIGSLTDIQVKKLLALKKIDPKVGLDFLENMVYDIDKKTAKLLIENKKSYFEMFGKEPPLGSLRPYQTINVAYGYYAQRALIGDSYGLGKTHTMGGIINLLRKCEGEKLGKVLVLGEKNTVYQLQEELVRITGLRTAVTTGQKKDVENVLKEIDECDIIIGTHSLLGASVFTTHVIYNKTFNVLFVDESSVFKTEKSDLASKLSAFSGLVKYMFELNATPIELELMDLYTQLYLLDKKLLPARTTFEKEYYAYDYTKFVPKKLSCKAGMEEKARTRMSLRYNGYSRKMLSGYSVEDGNLIEVIFVEKSREQKFLLGQKHTWQLVLDAPMYIDKNMEISEETVPKLKAISDLAKTRMKNKKTLIYCRYKQVHEHLKVMLEGQGYNVAIINGETDSNVRNETKNEFNYGEIDVIISSLKRGIDLVNGDICVMYTLETNPQKLKQIEGRILRSMKPEGKEFYVLLTERSEETRKVKGIMKKRDDTAKKVVNLDESILNECIRQVQEKERTYRKALT